MLLEQRLASEEQDRLSDSYSNPSAAAAGVRMIVVSWMVEVAEEYRLQQETLHMAVLLLDRFTALSEVCVLWFWGATTIRWWIMHSSSLHHTSAA